MSTFFNTLNPPTPASGVPTATPPPADNIQTAATPAAPAAQAPQTPSQQSPSAPQTAPTQPARATVQPPAKHGLMASVLIGALQGASSHLNREAQAAAPVATAPPTPRQPQQKGPSLISKIGHGIGTALKDVAEDNPYGMGIRTGIARRQEAAQKANDEDLMAKADLHTKEMAQLTASFNLDQQVQEATNQLNSYISTEFANVPEALNSFKLNEANARHAAQIVGPKNNNLVIGGGPDVDGDMAVYYADQRWIQNSILPTDFKVQVDYTIENGKIVPQGDQKNIPAGSSLMDAYQAQTLATANVTKLSAELNDAKAKNAAEGGKYGGAAQYTVTGPNGQPLQVGAALDEKTGQQVITTPGPLQGQPLPGNAVEIAKPTAASSELKTDVIQRTGKDGQTHNILINKDTGADIKDLGAKGAEPGEIPGNPNISGIPYLGTLPPAQAAAVKAIGEGRTRITPTMFRTKDGQTLLAMVTQAYPDFDETKAESWEKSRNEYMVGGKNAQKVIAFNTAEEHLADLFQHATWQGIAVPGTKDFSDYQAAQTFVAHEVGTAIKNGVISESEGQEITDAMSGWTPWTARDRIKEVDSLLNNKIQEVQNNFNNTAPSAAVKVPTLMSPEARRAHEMIQGNTNQQSPNRPPAQTGQVPAGARPIINNKTQQTVGYVTADGQTVRF